MSNTRALIAVLTAALTLPPTLGAQEHHILFKGIEVTGKAAAFTDSLKTKGFTLTRNGTADGMFAGSHVTVAAEVTPLSKTVYSVCAQLDARGTWKEVKGDYMSYKNNLADKYGEPSSCEERFTSAYHEGDGYEFKAIQLGKCTWASIWDTDRGRITISIVNGSRGCCLQIIYADKSGSLLNAKEINEIFKREL